MRLSDYKGFDLPQLGLKRFSWSFGSWNPYVSGTGELRRLASMTALTHLELSFVRTSSGEMQLQSLRLLQKLDLNGCGNLGQKLIELRAFPVLRELHIEDNPPTDELGYPDVQRYYPHSRLLFPTRAHVLLDSAQPGLQMQGALLDAARSLMKEDFVHCMSIVLNIPSMRKISGKSPLLALGLPESSPGWAGSRARDGTVTWNKI